MRHVRYATLQETDVIILCGGFGTRLRGIIDDRPKSMVEIVGKPFMDILIDYLVKNGASRFILCTGYMGEFIKRHYENKEKGRRLKFIISEEKKPLGTAGAIKNAELYIESDPFLVVNGDSFCKMSFKEFLRFHFIKKAFLSIAVTTIEDSRDYGLVELNDNQKIINFNEKKFVEGTGLINAGIYLFSRGVLKEIPHGEKQSLEFDIIPKILNKGVYGYKIKCPVLDIGTPERLEKAIIYFKGKIHDKKSRYYPD